MVLHKFIKLQLLLVFALTLLSGCNQQPQDYINTSYEGEQEPYQLSDSDTLPKGTKVDDFDLSGLTPDNAEVQLENWAKDKLEQTLSLVYNDKEVNLTLHELGAELDQDRTWEELLKNPGMNIDSILKIDNDTLSRFLKDNFKKVKSLPKNASYKIKNDKVVITPAVPGNDINKEALITEIQALNLSEIPSSLELPVKEITPKVTTEELEASAFDSVVGQFSTKFSVSEKNRTYNLTAAAKALDCKLIKPGEVFSFNKTVGPRTAETGYKDAYIIIDNEYVKGTGGGICQVSSTLYNAALLADLKVVERNPHAVAVAYVPLGQDATVNYPKLDFRFKNNTSSLLYLRTQVKSGVLTVKIWGKKTNKKVSIKHEIEKETNFRTERRYDPSLAQGYVIREQIGTKGYTVKTYKMVIDEQGQETETLLSRDVYAPANKILRIGI